MNGDDALRQAGLDLLRPRLEEAACRNTHWPSAPYALFLGREGQVGTNNPLPSECPARVTLAGATVWVPCPVYPRGSRTAARGPSTSTGGNEYVTPGGCGCASGKKRVTYLTVSDWIYDAFASWRFPVWGQDEGGSTVLDRLKDFRDRQAGTLPSGGHRRRG